MRCNQKCQLAPRVEPLEPNEFALWMDLAQSFRAVHTCMQMANMTTRQPRERCVLLIQPGCPLLLPAYCIHNCLPLFWSLDIIRIAWLTQRPPPLIFLAVWVVLCLTIHRGGTGCAFWEERKKCDFVAQKALPRIHCTLQQAKLRRVWVPALDVLLAAVKHRIVTTHPFWSWILLGLSWWLQVGCSMRITCFG